MPGTLHRFSRRLRWCVSYYTVGTSPIRNFARLDLKGQKKGEHVRQTTFCVEGRAVSILLVLYQHISNCNYILVCIIYCKALPSNSHRVTVFTISRHGIYIRVREKDFEAWCMSFSFLGYSFLNYLFIYLFYLYVPTVLRYSTYRSTVP